MGTKTLPLDVSLKHFLFSFPVAYSFRTRNVSMYEIHTHI